MEKHKITFQEALFHRYLSLLALLATCFYAGFLLGLFFDLEDGGDMFLRNVG
jgi:hypothetical protein